MDTKRNVDLVIIFKLLRTVKPASLVGLVFTTLSLFVFIPLILILPGALKEPFEHYNFDEIKIRGVETNAKVTNVETKYNVEVNGKHPQIISYEYQLSGKTINDKFKTLDLDSTPKIGTDIKILAYQNQSMIKGLDTFNFPANLFFILPGMFLLIGLPLLLIGLIPALKTFNLYKTGIVKKAFVFSITSRAGNMLRNGINQGLLVSYYFLDQFGNKIWGESVTNEMLFLNIKEGEEVKIFVSENDETQSCLIPKLEAMKYNWNI
jgi:hypothetical protein